MKAGRWWCAGKGSGSEEAGKRERRRPFVCGRGRDVMVESKEEEQGAVGRKGAALQLWRVDERTEREVVGEGIGRSDEGRQYGCTCGGVKAMERGQSWSIAKDRARVKER